MGSVIGLDVGQRVDPTAICVSEPDAGAAPVFNVRYLQRLPLGTPYPAVAARVAAVAAGVYQRTGEYPRLFVDATGVGQPLVDLLEAAGEMGRISAVYFTHGDRRIEQGDGSVSLGKAWLVSRLQVLLQGRRIHLPDTAEADALVDELLNYELRVSEDANDKYGAFRVGTHDDLVTALGLAVQTEPAWRWV